MVQFEITRPRLGQEWAPGYIAKLGRVRTGHLTPIHSFIHLIEVGRVLTLGQALPECLGIEQ